mmetsp:Transcript_17637/g.48443  ORF Transcript_17637/g.48443 Transcript_17637/m.48443 type:complete len:360 (-) Transcript_17637:97-1176(-)
MAPVKKRKREAKPTAAADEAGPDEAVAPAPPKRKKKRLVPTAGDSLGAAHSATSPVADAPGADGPRKRKAADGASTAVAGDQNERLDSGVDTLPLEKSKKKKKKALGKPDVETPCEAPTPDGAHTGAAKAEDWTVFVDGVPYDWTSDKVREHFMERCGEVTDVRAPTWQDSGRLRGFAHVGFANRAARDKALALDGMEVGKKGRYLKIEVAKPPSALVGPNVSDLVGKRRLFVRNLPYDATEAEILEVFKSCGKINDIRVPTSFGRCKGFAYIEFAKSEFLCAAAKMQPPAALRGRILYLDADEGNGPRAGFTYRPEAYDSGFGRIGRGGRGRGRGDTGGRGGRQGGGGRGTNSKLSLF